MGAAMDLTIDAMRSKDEAKLKSILAALWHLSANSDDTKSEICAVDGALGFLLDMLDYEAPSKSRVVAENASGVLKNVSSHVATREEYRLSLREKDCMGVLLRHLKSQSIVLVNNVCGTLNNLSKNSTQDQRILRDSIFDSQSIPVLQSLAKSKHKVISANAQVILRNLLTVKNCSFDFSVIKRDENENVNGTKDERTSRTFGSGQSYVSIRTHVVDNYKITNDQDEIRYIYPLSENSNKNEETGVDAKRCTKSDSTLRDENYDSVKKTEGSRTSLVPWNSPSESTESFVRLRPCSPVDENSSINEILVSEEEGISKPRYPKYSVRRSPIFNVPRDKDNSSFDEDANDQPVDYSKKYVERNAAMENVKPGRSGKKEYAVPRSKVNLFGDYAETDLDQPTDYSLRYAEDDTDEDEKPERGYFPGSEQEDTIQTYCTEGTPYQTPFIFSTATSMSDLRAECSKDAETFKKPSKRVHEKQKEVPLRPSKVSPLLPKDSKDPRNIPILNSGITSPEKPINYCEEGTPGYFSRVSSLSSLNSGLANLCIASPEDKPVDPDKVPETEIEEKPSEVTTPHEEKHEESVVDKEANKVVTFSEDHCEQTPLMFSRCSSLSSLSGFEQQSIHEDRSSVSDFSRMTSGIISPSELPDSPTQTVPPSPRHRKTPLKLPLVRQQVFEKTLLLTRSIFEDELAAFKEESTPIEFSAATSLSSLTIDDDSSKETMEENEGVKSRNSAGPCRSSQLNKKNEQVSDGDEDDEDILAACINMGMQSNRFKQSSKKPNLVRYPPCSTLNRLETATLPIPIKQSGNRRSKVIDGSPDTMHIYCTEDTPAYISPVGSHSNLSALSLASIPDYEENVEEGKTEESSRKQDLSDESSNLSGDEDKILDKCIQSGMPKEHSRHKTSAVIKSVGKFKLCTPSTSPVESGPDNLGPVVAFSTPEIKFAGEMYDDSPNHSEDEAILAECIKSAMPKTTTAAPRRNPVKFLGKSTDPELCGCSTSPGKFLDAAGGEKSGLEVLEDGSSLSEEEEDMMLAQCIKSGMPKAQTVRPSLKNW